MQSPISKAHFQISKLGVLSLKIDAITERFNDLHNRLINDWRPKVVEQIKQTKYEIQNSIKLLDQLYQNNILDTRSSYIQILILKLKKSMNSQNQLNVILENERQNINQQKGSHKNSRFQSYFEKDSLNLNEQKQIKNKINSAAEQSKPSNKANKKTLTPVKQMPKAQRLPKYSPIRNKQPTKVKVVVNNLTKRNDSDGRLRQYNRSRSPEDISKYQSPVDKMGSAKFNKNSNNLAKGEKLSNTQKLQNLMLTIKMTKQEYYQYMKDN